MKLKKLNNVFSLTSGIFTRLRTKQDIPWGSDAGLAGVLDLQYLMNHSGEKWCAPLLNKEDSELTENYKDSAVQIVWTMYKNKWTRLWALNNIEYDPIENYSMIEKKTGTDTGLKTPSNWKSSTEHTVSQDYKETDTDKPTNWKEEHDHHASNDYKATETETPTDWKKVNESLKADNEAENTTQIIPFNGSDFASTGKTKTEVKSKQTEEQQGTYKKDSEVSGHLYDDVTQSGTYAREHTQTGSKKEETTQSGTFEDKMTYNTELRRSGNIGITTSQMMAESEIKLWQWLFFEEVFKDIDNIFTLSTY